MIFSTLSLASPRSIWVFSLKKSGLTRPAYSVLLIDRLKTTTLRASHTWSLSVISSIILWIAYLSSKNKLVAKIAAACTLSISVVSFVVFWIYLNFYSVVGFGDAAFFLPIPFGVMILGIAWCVNVFKYQNEKPAYYANAPLNGQYVVSPQYPNQPPQYQYSLQ